MIFVMLGSSPYSFKRLLNAVNDWAVENNEHVIAQTGHTVVDNMSIECRDFIDHNEIMKLIEESDYVICQGGFGSLRDCLELAKPVIAVSRMPEYKEALHSQNELVDALENEGRLIALNDVSKLSDAISKIKVFVPPKNSRTKLPALVAEIIEAQVNGGSK